MSTQEITIQGHTFVAPAPYAEGHQLNEAEAKTLNQVLGENLRNNFATKVKSAMEAEGGMSEEKLAELREAFAAYAEEYEFQGKRQARQPADPVAKEAQKMAREAILQKLKEAGKKQSDLADGVLDQLVKQLGAREDYMAEARKRIEQVKIMALGSLDDILSAPAAA